jgi:16S rRNA (guanine527-N7)-methyltransferase
MTPNVIAPLMVLYLENNGQGIVLPETLLSQISIYVDLLLRWNARTNLTAIRSPEEIITRHFGESLFAAQQIFPAGNSATDLATTTLADVGSGAGFPGLPIKIWAPQLHVTLIESHQKKATFLREVIRALELTSVEVQATRAESITQSFDTVTLRAVERFDQVLPAAARLVRTGGRVALLISEDQIPLAKTLLPAYKWDEPRPIPNSQRRVVFVGNAPEDSSL